MVKKTTIILTILITFISCEKMFLGEDEINNPENNFELFWNDFDKHYGLFEARNWDWDNIYNQYRPQVNSSTTDDELWNIFKEMVTYLDDSHTGISRTPNKEDLFFWSGSEGNDVVEQEFSIELLQSKYLENVVHFDGDENVPGDDGYFYGKVKNKNIGYIYLQNIDLSGSADIFDDILNQIGSYDAIIFDIRNNEGGTDIYAEEIAGRFADSEHFIYTVQERNGPNHTDFTEKKKFFSKPIGANNYSKPVILLTDQITVSAADIFTLHMKSFPKVTQIGSTTAGDYSDVSMLRFLPNGWVYHYSIMMYLLPNGESLDGIGSIPDIYIKNTITDIQNEDDKVVERAIQYLFDEYGIN